MPKMIGTYEEPGPYHEGCKRKYSSNHCATSVEYKQANDHYNVKCEKKDD